MPYNSSGRLQPGGLQPPRPVGSGQPGVSYTPQPGQVMPRQLGQNNQGGVDGLRRQLVKLTSDLAMAQAEGKSPRHIAEIQGKIYAIQLEIQIAQEKEAGTADWLGEMTQLASSHSTRPYDNLPGGG